MVKPKTTKILFAGGGTGGHFYPIIAIAEKIHTVAMNERIANIALFFMSDNPIDKELSNACMSLMLKSKQESDAPMLRSKIFLMCSKPHLPA